MTPTKGNEMKQAYLLSNNQGENVYAVVANNSTEALATLFEEAPDYDDGTLTDDDFKALKESSYSLHDHNTGEELRQATAEELVASINAAIADGGIGVIKCADRRCYVA